MTKKLQEDRPFKLRFCYRPYGIAYEVQTQGAKLRFHRVNAPTASELNTLVDMISQPIARYLERQGVPMAE